MAEKRRDGLRFFVENLCFIRKVTDLFIVISLILKWRQISSQNFVCIFSIRNALEFYQYQLQLAQLPCILVVNLTLQPNRFTKIIKYTYQGSFKSSQVPAQTKSTLLFEINPSYISAQSPLCPIYFFQRFSSLATASHLAHLFTRLHHRSIET